MTGKVYKTSTVYESNAKYGNVFIRYKKMSTKTKKVAKVKSKGGRPTFKPTKEQREKVESMSGYGLTAEQICNLVEVSRGTLFKYFGEELKLGEGKAHAQVTHRAFDMARSGRFPAMTMFWLKCRAGWTEKIQITNDDLPPIEITGD